MPSEALLGGFHVLGWEGRLLGHAASIEGHQSSQQCCALVPERQGVLVATGRWYPPHFPDQCWLFSWRTDVLAFRVNDTLWSLLCAHPKQLFRRLRLGLSQFSPGLLLAGHGEVF